MTWFVLMNYIMLKKIYNCERDKRGYDWHYASPTQALNLLRIPNYTQYKRWKDNTRKQVFTQAPGRMSKVMVWWGEIYKATKLEDLRHSGEFTDLDVSLNAALADILVNNRDVASVVRSIAKRFEKAERALTGRQQL